MTGSVVGVVRTATGSPVIGAAVLPTPLGAPAVPDLAVLTDANGTYRWTLPAGRYRLVAHEGGRSSAPVEVSVSADESVVADLVLP